MNTADKINFKILMSHFRQFVFLTIASFFFLATESTAREKPNRKSNETNLLDISPALWKKVEKIIQYSGNTGDKVMDMFLGGFTTARVALQLGREPLGFEINKRAYEHFKPRFHKAR